MSNHQYLVVRYGPGNYWGGNPDLAVLGIYTTPEAARASIQEEVDAAVLKRWRECHTPVIYSSVDTAIILKVPLNEVLDPDLSYECVEVPSKWTEEAWKAHPDYATCEEQKKQWRAIYEAEQERKLHLAREAQIKRAVECLAYVADCKSRGVEPLPGSRRGRGRGRGPQVT